MSRRGQGKAVTWLRDRTTHRGANCLIWPFFRLPNGYGTLGVDGKMHYAHRFMCTLVKGKPPTSKHEAAHSCGNGDDGCVHPEHLSWKTKSGNALDSRKHGTQARNPWGNRGKITANQAAAIRAMKGKKTQAEIAQRFQISQPTVRDILAGRTHTKPNPFLPHF